MTQPAKGQEPSMEEILASIRRIIADDPPKTPHNAGSSSDSGHTGGTRIVGGQESLRRTQHNQGFYEGAPHSDTPAERIPHDDAEDEDTLPSIQGASSHSSHGFAETWPSETTGRASSAPLASPAAEAGTQREEIEAFLAELGSSSEDSPEALEDHAQPIPIAEALPEPEFATSEPAIEQEDGQEEQSPPEPEEEELAPVAVSRRASPQPRPQAREHPQRPHGSESAGEALISANTSAAVNSAFNTLAQTVLVQNGRTLEDLVREMLRPMLKTWLDDNLPGMVERLVRAEIERVSRGRG